MEMKLFSKKLAIEFRVSVEYCSGYGTCLFVFLTKWYHQATFLTLDMQPIESWG